ncbi:MAG: TlpA family protein disulfide reductase [Gammaproteobacteria bacterium]
MLASFKQAFAVTVGDPLPQCNLTSIDGTRAVELSAFKDKVMYIDFWASWCGPCAKSFPFMNQLHHELGDKDLALIGVNLDENPEDAKAFLAQYPAGFTMAADPGEQCARLFDVKAMPSSYLIGRDGIIRHVHLGFRADEGKELRDLVEKLLAETIPAVDTK